MRKHTALRRQRGYGLLEIALGIAIAALLVAGAMMYFANASNNRKQNEAMQQVAAIQSVVRSLYSGQPDYTDLTSVVVGQSKQLPNKFVKADGTLTSPFAGAVTVEATNTAQNFAVTLTNVPDQACNALVTQDLGTGLREMTVGAVTVQARAMTPAQANTACVGNNNNTITWDFF